MDLELDHPFVHLLTVEAPQAVQCVGLIVLLREVLVRITIRLAAVFYRKFEDLDISCLGFLEFFFHVPDLRLLAFLSFIMGLKWLDLRQS